MLVRSATLAAIAALATFTVVARASAEEMPVPLKLQGVLFKKIFPYDQTLQASGDVEVLVVYGADSGSRQDEIVSTFNGMAIPTRAVAVGDVGVPQPNHVLYVLPGAGSVRELCEEHKLLSITGVPELVASGEVAIGVGLEDNKPKILIHRAGLERTGHQLSAKLMQLAKIYE